MSFSQKLCVPEMYSVVGVVRCADQEFGIQSIAGSVDNIAFSQWIHVMDDWSAVNFTTLDTQVASQVSRNDVATKTSPLRRCIEPLIDPSIEPEGFTTDLTLQSQVFVSFQEGIELDEFRICSNLRVRHTLTHPHSRNYHYRIS